MTCPASEIGTASREISCTTSDQDHTISILRNTENLVSCHKSTCESSFPEYKESVTFNETHRRVSLIIDKVRMKDEGMLTCDVGDSRTSGRQKTTCLFFVFVRPEKPFCSRTSNTTHVLMACSTEKVYPAAVCRWNVTSSAGVLINLKSKRIHSTLRADFYYNTTCSATFTHDNQSDYSIRVDIFPADIKGNDLSEGVALVTIVPGSVDENADSSHQVGLIFLLLILITVGIFLVYILVVKGKRLEDKRSSGVYKDAWIDSTRLAATLPQQNKIKEIARRPRQDLPKAKAEVTRQRDYVEEEREPYARISNTNKRTGNVNYASDHVYNNGTMTSETSSTESAPCTEQLNGEEKWDTTRVSGKTIVQSHEPDELMTTRTTEYKGPNEEMNDVDEQEICEEQGDECFSN